MKIAQVAPLYESVPPKLYGGTERVVSYLTEELSRQGHEVCLFASGDSVTQAQLIPTGSTALRLNPAVQDPLAHHIVQMQEVVERAQEFDVLHFHNDYLYFPISRLLEKPHLTTLHGRLDIPDLQPVYQKFKDQPVVSISNDQRKPLPHANWQATVYHGLPLDLYAQGSGQGDYVAFLGRISPEKRVDRAIEIAGKAGVKIKIAAKIDKADAEYFERKIKKLLELPHVEYIGEIGEKEKGSFLGNAKALLFPIDWPEPFGMVVIEAMACGTPIIAYKHGSVPEIIDHKQSGFIVDSIDEAVQALKSIDQLDRNEVRRVFETRFSVRTMAKNYLKVYERLIEKHVPRKRKKLFQLHHYTRQQRLQEQASRVPA